MSEVSIDFAVIRDSLRTLHDAVGGNALVSFAWDGTLMRCTVARPETRLKPFVMTFDSEADYSIDPSALISQFAVAARAWFGSPT